jgi:hypothetical protein
MGPELLRVKDLARRSNDYTEADYRAALKVLKRINARKYHGIVISRGGAGRELVPASTRSPVDASASLDAVSPDDTGFPISTAENEVLHRTMLFAHHVPSSDEYAVREPDFINIPRLALPLNSHYRLIVYADASFAIGEHKQSVSGFVIFLNGVPILWGL